MVAEVREWLHRLRQTDRATLLAISDALTVLRVAGDKSGQWRHWYSEAIRQAQKRYQAYLKETGQ
jgi:hypothetical protein